MKPLNRILVPVDFSAGSEEAVRYAAALAADSGSEIHLLHVLPPPEFGFAMVEPDLAGLLARRGDAAFAELSRLPVPGKATPVRFVAEGEPGPQIVEYANRNNKTRLTIGHKHHGVSRLRYSFA